MGARDWRLLCRAGAALVEGPAAGEEVLSPGALRPLQPGPCLSSCDHAAIMGRGTVPGTRTTQQARQEPQSSLSNS